MASKIQNTTQKMGRVLNIENHKEEAWIPGQERSYSDQYAVNVKSLYRKK